MGCNYCPWKSETENIRPPIFVLSILKLGLHSGNGKQGKTERDWQGWIWGERKGWTGSKLKEQNEVPATTTAIKHTRDITNKFHSRNTDTPRRQSQCLTSSQVGTLFHFMMMVVALPACLPVTCEWHNICLRTTPNGCKSVMMRVEGREWSLDTNTV